MTYDCLLKTPLTQAFEAGRLVDVSDYAKEIGFVEPVAMTTGCWKRYVEVPDSLAGIWTEAIRVRNILWMLRHVDESPDCNHMVPNGPNSFSQWFKLYIQNSSQGSPQFVTLDSIWFPGNNNKTAVIVLDPTEEID